MWYKLMTTIQEIISKYTCYLPQLLPLFHFKNVEKEESPSIHENLTLISVITSFYSSSTSLCETYTLPRDFLVILLYTLALD